MTENINKNIEIIKNYLKRNQTNSVAKNVITEIKNSLDGYSSRFENAEETIRPLDKLVEVM